LGTRRWQKEKASLAFGIAPDLQEALWGSMATSICPDTAAGELCSSGGTESKQAVHVLVRQTGRKQTVGNGV